MKKLAFVSFILLCICSCSNKKNIPDVSNINVQLTIQRFDKDLFSMDTNNVSTELTRLQKNYSSFLNDYLYNILAVPPQTDSTVKKVKMFIHDYKIVYDSAQTIFASTDKMQKEIQKGLQFVKYYFPNYKLPSTVITF